MSIADYQLFEPNLKKLLLSYAVLFGAIEISVTQYFTTGDRKTVFNHRAK